MNNILILGVNGFIGHHLSTRILSATDWRVYGMDMNSERITRLQENPRFHFFEGDITINREWIEYHIKKCDVVLPLVAIATPATYVREPLRVFELDFEANLAIVRLCVKHRKRVLFPSTSEVYGMCRDSEFDPHASELVYGPIEKQRWIYACSKQLLDRVIHAYGLRDELDYTLFRPFNWIGSGLDNIHAANSLSVRELATEMLRIAATYPEYRDNAAKVRLVDTTATEYYGKGYQDVENRVPKIDNICADLDWSPRVSMQDALRQIFDAYRGEIAQAGRLLEQEARP